MKLETWSATRALLDLVTSSLQRELFLNEGERKEGGREEGGRERGMDGGMEEKYSMEALED